MKNRKKKAALALAGLLYLPSISVAAAGEEEQVSIEFFQMKDEGTEYYDRLIAEFESLYPHIHVEHTNVPESETIIMTRMAADEVPDVFTHYPLSENFRKQVEAGYVMDLTGEDMLDGVNGSILDLSLIDGKAYSVPVSLNMMGIYYNKELFRQAGITRLPGTIEELYGVCADLMEAGIQPFVFPDQDVWTVRQFCDRTSVTMLEDPEGLFQSIAAGETSAADSRELRLMAETIVRLRDYGQKDHLGTGQEKAITDFSNGEAAMFFSGTFAYPELIRKNPRMNMEMFPFPSIGGANTDRVGVNIDTAFSISASTRYPEEARLFVEFCTSRENAQSFCDYDGSPSAMEGVVYSTDVFQRMYEDYILAGKTVGIPANSWPGAFGAEYGNIGQELIATGDVDTWLEELDELIHRTYG